MKVDRVLMLDGGGEKRWQVWTRRKELHVSTTQGAPPCTHQHQKHTLPPPSSELLSTVTGGVGATKKGLCFVHDRDVAVNQSPQRFGADVE